MGLFLVWCHWLICIVLSLCQHACKEVYDVKQEIDPSPLLARSCDRWWPDFVTFTACKRAIFGLKRGKKAQCVSNRCKDLFKWKKKRFWCYGHFKVQSPELTESWLNHEVAIFFRKQFYNGKILNPLFEIVSIRSNISCYWYIRIDSVMI